MNFWKVVEKFWVSQISIFVIYLGRRKWISTRKFRIYWTIWIKFRILGLRSSSYKVVSFVKIGTVKAIRCIRAAIRFFLHLLLSSLDLENTVTRNVYWVTAGVRENLHIESHTGRKHTLSVHSTFFVPLKWNSRQQSEAQLGLVAPGGEYLQ
jgi:hypothetical protein